MLVILFTLLFRFFSLPLVFIQYESYLTFPNQRVWLAECASTWKPSLSFGHQELHSVVRDLQQPNIHQWGQHFVYQASAVYKNDKIDRFKNTLFSLDLYSLVQFLKPRTRGIVRSLLKLSQSVYGIRSLPNMIIKHIPHSRSTAIRGLQNKNQKYLNLHLKYLWTWSVLKWKNGRS